MASSFAPDDQTDADFFDKLVDDDDAAHDAAASLARDVSDISLADDDPPATEAAAAAAAPPPPEGASPGSAKAAGAGLHTTVKQAQWASFGAGPDDGADPFADLSGGAAADADASLFFGTQTLVDASVVGTSDHDFFFAGDHTSPLPAAAAQVTDHDLFGGTPSTSDQNADGRQQLQSAADPTDPKYLETVYPGWKYDEATQQWYQVDALNTAGNAAQNLHQQQQLDASYQQNSAHAGLEPIAEEGAATAGASSWGQGQGGAAAEYPPNMLFYAEYPGWYFDTNTQQWMSLESYQQAATQAGTTGAALQTGGAAAASGAVAASGVTGYNAKQTEHLTVHNQVTQHNSFTTPQSQQQTADAFGNTVQPESATGNSLTSSFYGFNQHANAETISSSTSQQVAFSTAETVTDHYGGHKSFDSSSLQTGYSSSDSQQSSYKAFEPSAGYHAGYKAFEPAMGPQTSHNAIGPSISSQSGYKAFEPSTGNRSASGFMPSTGHQASYKEFETSTGYNTGFKISEPSSAQHASYMGSQTSSGHQPSNMGFDTSANHQGYGDVNGAANTQGFFPMQSTYHLQNQENANPQGHLSNSYLSTENSMNFNQQQFLGVNSSNYFGHSHQEGRSSAGRPPHALVAFGFGGKLIVMKETTSMTTSFNSGNQVP
jgi:hypothetical protein